MMQFHRDALGEFGRAGKATVILFGSVARGDYRIDSDMDVAIVSDDARVRKKAEEIADRTLFEHGRVVSLVFFGTAEFEEKKRRRDPFVLDILKGKTL